MVLRASLAVAMVMLAVLSSAACTREGYVRRQVTFGYVLEKGSSEQITEWTLSQQDVGPIRDGTAALRAILRLRNPREANAAVEGMIVVYRKILTGWPSPEEANRLSASLVEGTEMVAAMESSNTFQRRLADELARLYDDHLK